MIEDLFGIVHVVFDVIENARIVAEKVPVDRRTFQQWTENVNQLEHRFETVAIAEGLIGNASNASIEVTDTTEEMFDVVDEGLEGRGEVFFSPETRERGVTMFFGSSGL